MNCIPMHEKPGAFLGTGSGRKHQGLPAFDPAFNKTRLPQDLNLAVDAIPGVAQPIPYLGNVERRFLLNCQQDP